MLENGVEISRIIEHASGKVEDSHPDHASAFLSVG